MLEEFMNVMTDESVNKVENEKLDAEVQSLIDGLELFSNNIKMLTNAYTDILMDDNVVYLITRISQSSVLCENFPELYIQNEFGESVINCQQNSPYHRYGVFRHILYTVEYVGKDNLKYSKRDLRLLKWTMFLHDIGKPFVKTTNSEGRDSFAGHDEVSVNMAEQILNRLDFTEQDKKIILTLIKYHDRYLNEGELTQDNLEFLAQELENKKELFELLIEVKEADNKAKSMDVYNKFLTVLPKYKEFAASYFKETKPQNDETLQFGINFEDQIVYSEEIIIDDLNKNSEQVRKEEKITNRNKNVSTKDFNKVYDNIINDEDVNCHYIPIIDVSNQTVFAYETQISFADGENVEQVLLKAREEGKYDRIEQLLFINQANNGLKEKTEKSTALLIKIDMASFDSYNNKNRIYDMTDNDNIIISFKNYDYFSVMDINRLCKEIAKKHGRTSLSEFNKSSITLNELSNLNVDFVEFNLEEKMDDEKLEAIIESCKKDMKNIIIKNVKNRKEFIKSKDMNVFYIQGQYLFDTAERMEIAEHEIKKALNKN